MPDWLTPIWGFLQGLLPVDRWVQTVGNVLKYFSLAFVLVTLLIVLILTRNWGLTADQRFILVLGLIGLLFVALMVVLVLAIKQGDLLFSPYERSLRRGRNYGTRQRPQSRSEAMAATGESSDTTLQPPSSHQIPGPPQ